MYTIILKFPPANTYILGLNCPPSVVIKDIDINKRGFYEPFLFYSTHIYGRVNKTVKSSHDSHKFVDEHIYQKYIIL